MVLLTAQFITLFNQTALEVRSRALQAAPTLQHPLRQALLQSWGGGALGSQPHSEPPWGTYRKDGTSSLAPLRFWM